MLSQYQQENTQPNNNPSSIVAPNTPIQSNNYGTGTTNFLPRAGLQFNAPKQAPNTIQSDLSLSDMLSQISNRPNSDNGDNKEATTLTNVYGQRSAAIDSKRINELWVRFARSIEQSDTHLYTIMQQMPVINNSQLNINVETDLQANKVIESAELINFLRQETGINSLVLNPIVIENNSSGNCKINIASSRERLNEMIKENKAIEALVNEFNFDLDT